MSTSDNYNMRRGKIKWLAMAQVTLLLTCAFDAEEDEIASTAKYEVSCQSVGAGSTQLNSNDIRRLAVGDAGLWISAWGGGISLLDTNDNITTYRAPQISSDFCPSIGAKNRVMASCVDSSGNYHLDFFNNSWIKDSGGFTPTANPLIDIEFNGTNFFVIQDRRTEGFLQASFDGSSGTDVLTMDDIGLAVTATRDNNLELLCQSNANAFMYYTDLGGTPGACGQGTCAPTVAQNNNKLGCLALGDTWTPSTKTLNRAVVEAAIDKQGEVIAVGSFFDQPQGVPPAASDQAHAGLHKEIPWMHLALFRLKSDLTPKNPGTPINPIEFGPAWEVPLAMAYVDRSKGTFVTENVYVATNAALYKIIVKSYSDVFDVRRFDSSNGLKTNNVRAVAASEDEAWLATDQGVFFFDGDFDQVQTSEYKKLASNNIQAIAVFNGATYAGTDQGLCKIVKIPEEEN